MRVMSLGDRVASILKRTGWTAGVTAPVVMAPECVRDDEGP